MDRHEYRRLRRYLGTQKEVAEMLDVSRNTMSRRENGRLPIDTEAEHAIRRLFERQADTDTAPTP